MLVWRHFATFGRIAFVQWRQDAVFANRVRTFLAVLIVLAFAVKFQEAIKGDHRPGGAHLDHRVAGVENDGNLVEDG